MELNYSAVIIGIGTLLIIGIYHPIVRKCEYYFSKKIWPVFLVLGIVSIVASLLIFQRVASALLAINGVTCFWTIKELFEQEERAIMGQAKRNPKRTYPEPDSVHPHAVKEVQTEKLRKLVDELHENDLRGV